MWRRLSMNPKTICGIFGNDEPSLKHALLKRINFNNNGPVVDIFFEVENYPSIPPIKWMQQGYNAAQICMKLIEVSSVKLTGWGRNNVVNIELAKIEDNLIYLKAEGAGCNIEIAFKWFDVRVTGYLKDTVK
ncbi:MAG TPA: Imm50 family immunity protein [Chitinophaga sp.]|uniref:Imm50 family immunity protein n=1 Tax=Chitinophaga sp. TaxID=1869181 RepID=UPI002DBE3692|nr:Imm50 family immunity protein [Chitinophaga sp.]HEU4551360.1 Imm50 family immunity protein [Chitinophaga sp.]